MWVTGSTRQTIGGHVVYRILLCTYILIFLFHFFCWSRSSSLFIFHPVVDVFFFTKPRKLKYQTDKLLRLATSSNGGGASASSNGGSVSVGGGGADGDEDDPLSFRPRPDKMAPWGEDPTAEGARRCLVYHTQSQNVHYLRSVLSCCCAWSFWFCLVGLVLFGWFGSVCCWFCLLLVLLVVLVLLVILVLFGAFVSSFCRRSGRTLA